MGIRSGQAKVYRRVTKMMGVSSSNTIFAKIRDDAQSMVSKRMPNHAEVCFDTIHLFL
jgi:hypothetical protein